MTDDANLAEEADVHLRIASKCAAIIMKDLSTPLADGKIAVDTMAAYLVALNVMANIVCFMGAKGKEFVFSDDIARKIKILVEASKTDTDEIDTGQQSRSEH